MACESGWTGDRCTFPLFHDGPHSNEESPRFEYIRDLDERHALVRDLETGREVIQEYSDSDPLTYPRKEA